MSPLIDEAALETLRAVAARQFGLQFGKDKHGFLAQMLERRLERSGADSPAEYFRRLEGSSPSREELAALAAELTVPETYFFRGRDQLRALQEAILPERIRARRSSRQLRLLSVGCATGEEPYTLAILLAEEFPSLASWSVSILGLDLNPHLLQAAARGRYSAWSLRDTPQSVRDRCFRKEGTDYVLDDVYRERVAFREVNLSRPPEGVFLPGFYDVIFCRNVIMYFTPEVLRLVVDRIAQALIPEGSLFLGHAETLRGIPTELVLRHRHETFYYERPGLAYRAEEEPSVPPAAEDSALVPQRSEPELDSSWADAIRQSSDRIEVLSRDLDASPAPPPASEGELSGAMELLRQERFREALAEVSRILGKSPRDPRARLLEAVLHCQSGRPERAEELCGEILRADDLNPDAHHVLAICREQAGDIEQAIEEDRAAEYLDPAFAMPYVHAGRLARRSGNLALARRQLAQGKELLAREGSTRILYFGGGFGREALIELCRSELESCGGPP